MDIEKAKKLLNGIDIKFFLNGKIEQSNYIVDKADEVNKAIEAVLNELEKKDNKIKELEGRCRNLDIEAQSYLEELMGDSTLKNRTIKQLNSELEKKDTLSKKQYNHLKKSLKGQIKKKDKVIDLLADDLRYYEGMQQDQLFCIDTCEGKMCDEEHCKERIKEYFYKKVE